ncbi:MAG TPA: DUF6600 domain-containing protein [Thermoanaerobaculia bacterium]|jgi:hypothetical protein|nr:DUF6600 domain-containing protein [Thermoanaerobaculia bacterium]
MKTLRIALLTLLLLLGAAAGAGFASISTALGISVGPSGRSTVNLGFFYDDLAPYGNWVQSPRYGWVWTPLGVAETWQPYADGHWVWTDQGWTWITDEPFGWATYHYGRWYDDPALGWAWVPGYEWGPSWVSFVEAPSYVGWAPLPPSVALVSGFNGSRIALAPASYVFVPDRYFLAPRIVDYVVPAPRVLPLFRTARNVTAYRFAGDRVFVEGLPVTRFARFRRVPRYRVAELAPDLRLRAPRIQGDRIAFFRPAVRRTLVAPPSWRSAARRSVVPFNDFRKVRGQSALARSRTGVPPGLTRAPGQIRRTQAPAWGRKGLAPAQVRRNTVAPPRTAVRQHGPPDRVRAVRPSRSAQMKALPKQHGRPAVKMQHARPPTRVKSTRVRPTHSAPTLRHTRSSPRTHVRPAQRVHSQPGPAIKHARPGPSVRQHVRSAPQRMRAAPGPRQHQQARPGQHRPPR